MLERLTESYSGQKLISERMRHSGSFLDTILNKDGITILHNSIDDFLISNKEFKYVFSLFDLWAKYAITLPGFKSTGSSGCGITSLTYYPRNSKKKEFTINGHNEVMEYLNTDDYFKYRKIIDRAEKELSNKLKKKLTKPNGMSGNISRFELYITRELDNKKRRIIFRSKWEMDGFREITDYYSVRKKDYK